MIRQADFTKELTFALQVDLDHDGEEILANFLESKGFLFQYRSATNIRLLSAILPISLLSSITLAALATPVPDMALNNLERVSNLVKKEDLLVICSSEKRLLQLLVICGSSPFLSGIICKDPGLLKELFIDNSIDQRRDETSSLAALREQVDAHTSSADLFTILRRFKRREILRIAARDLNDLAPLEEVTLELSALAQASLQVAYEVSRRSLVKEYGTPLASTPDGIAEADMTILGMGKFGGRELNFSSDIDIIFIHSSSQGETTGISEGNGNARVKFPLHSFFVKLAELITKLLSQVTDEGFVFRVDLGLRPEGKSGDLTVSTRAAEIYYESWGQSWERAAMLKARPVAGSIPLGEQFLRNIEPFIYRKYLDYNLIEDIMSMKKKVDASLTREMEGEYNIKLGRGGIREIEFFIQALQLVYAGKNPALRKRNSLEALLTLKDARLINETDYKTLADAYRFLRTVEHRIQVVQERQTHLLPNKSDEMAALARRCRFLQPDGVESFKGILEHHRRNVSSVYGNLFLGRDEKLKEEVQPGIFYFFDRSADPEQIKIMLAENRFQELERAYDNLLLLRDGPPKARLTERARRLLEKISPLLLQEIFSSPDPDMSLGNLEKFLCAIGPRSTFYALLAENREILKLLVSLFGMSEFLSKIFISHPELLDSMVARSSASFLLTRGEMDSEIATRLNQTIDFEESLDVLRRYRHEQFLRIGINDIYGKLGQTEITTQLTILAESCLFAAYCLARKELSRFGKPTYPDPSGITKTADLAIIAMGKMGGMELNYHSDLDIIYIYDHQGITNGEKIITNREYFAKLGQKIISILTTLTREGFVYKIDTRLRPSGNAGPLVTSLDSFKNYHRKEAQVWERQALTKSRVVLGDEEITSSVNDVIRHAVYGSSIDDEGREEIHRLRMRMENELAKESAGNYNIKTGKGGMVDVEFVVQYLQLKHGKTFPEIRVPNTLNCLKALNAYHILPEKEATALIEGYKFLRLLENRLRIIHDYSMNDLGGSSDYLDKLALRLAYNPSLKNPGHYLIADYERLTSGIRKEYCKVFKVKA